MTIKALYAQITGDTTSHQRAIDARLRKLGKRQMGRIRDFAGGANYHDIATIEGVSAASVRDSILRGLEAIRKDLAQEPRFNKRGRAHGYHRKGGREPSAGQQHGLAAQAEPGTHTTGQPPGNPIIEREPRDSTRQRGRRSADTCAPSRQTYGQ